MLNKLIIPNKLKAGDKVAVVASSWGGPGSFPAKFAYGLKMLEDTFGVETIVMPFATANAVEVHNNPQKRAEDLMNAFKNPNIKAIISSIGGDESIRMLPYIDFDVIKENPKIYMGYSDSTISHFICLKAGLRSYYGPSIMAGFAENGGLIPFMENSVRKTLFSDEIIGTLENNDGYVVKQHNWGNNDLLNVKRDLLEVPKQKIINGVENAQGRLIGGCLEVLEFMKDTVLWDKEAFKGAILFIETSEDKPSADLVKYWFRNYAASGILANLAGIIVGRPQAVDKTESGKEYIDEQYNAILHIVKNEEKLDLPILVNANFGHTDPQMVMPFGAMAKIDIENASFAILEPGVK